MGFKPRLRWRSATDGRRWLAVKESSEPAVLAGVVALVLEMFRLAPDNLSDRQNLILFTWDPVYSNLSVTYSDKKRKREGRDTLKLICSGWDEGWGTTARRDALDRKRAELVAGWVEALLGEAEEVINHLCRDREVEFGFTADPTGADYEPI